MTRTQKAALNRAIALNQRLNKTKATVDDLLEQRNKAIRAAVDEKVSQTLIAHHLGLTRQGVSKILHTPATKREAS